MNSEPTPRTLRRRLRQYELYVTKWTAAGFIPREAGENAAGWLAVAIAEMKALEEEFEVL